MLAGNLDTQRGDQAFAIVSDNVLPKNVLEQLGERGNAAIVQITEQMARQTQLSIENAERAKLMNSRQGKAFGKPDLPVCDLEARKSYILVRAVRDAATSLLQESRKKRWEAARHTRETMERLERALRNVLVDYEYAERVAELAGIRHRGGNMKPGRGWSEVRSRRFDDPKGR